MTQQSGVTPKTPYGGYHGARSARIDETLQRVGKGTPGGEYLRRFWHPLMLSKDLGERPEAVALLGDELVVFRDRGGRVGLLDRYCSHRNASLEFGLVRERGIQCCYHGWHYDVDGTILDIPGDPNGAFMARQLCHGAYPVKEYKGLIFAYMGPPEAMPDFPVYDFMAFPDQDMVPISFFSPVNWLHVRENTQDPIHVSFLHTMFADPQFGPWSYDLPVIQWRETPIGQVTSSVRWVDGHLYARVNELILPNFSRVPDISFDFSEKPPTARRNGLSLWITPFDDTRCAMIGWAHFSHDMSAAERAQHTAMFSFGQDGSRSYEERHRLPGDWDAWVSQGAFAIHDNEHLVHSDGGIKLFRKQLREGIKAVQRGKDPKGILRNAAGPIRSYGCNLVKPCPARPGDAERWDLLKATSLEAIEASLDGRIGDVSAAAE
jgi:phenylpropionate dioxygenase-like ring-hydroxylating dioxygenase large terminal subunit